jgi:hypothetical protein
MSDPKWRLRSHHGFNAGGSPTIASSLAGKPVIAGDARSARPDPDTPNQCYARTLDEGATRVRPDAAEFPGKHLIFINNSRVTKAWRVKGLSMKLLHNFYTVEITASSEIVMPAKISHFTGSPS